MSMKDAPDYVRNFRKPPKPEIKCVRNHYYLYGCTYVYDKERKRSRKIPGEYLGTITPDGLVPPHAKAKAALETQPAKPYDCAETGAVCYFYPRTEDIRLRLKKHFPGSWEYIYTLALIRAIYDNGINMAQADYEYSILSHIFPDLSMSPGAVEMFLCALGTQREEIASFMREDLRNSSEYLLFNSHKMLTSSVDMYSEERIYSKARKPQFNAVCVFSSDKGICKPVYYKQYRSGVSDAYAFSDMLEETKISASDVTAFADYDCNIPDNTGRQDKSFINCIAELERDNPYIKDIPTLSLSGYDNTFIYRKTAIQSITLRHEDEGFSIHHFLDTRLMSAESDEIAFQAARKRNSGLGKSGPVPVNEALRNIADVGTVTLKTNRTDLDAQQCFLLYRQWKNTESTFASYSNTIQKDAAYIHDKDTEEGWLFINHLSSLICAKAEEAVSELDNISVRDLTRMLIKIQSAKTGDHRTKPVIKESTEKIFQKLGFDASDYSVLPL